MKNRILFAVAIFLFSCQSKPAKKTHKDKVPNAPIETLLGGTSFCFYNPENMYFAERMEMDVEQMFEDKTHRNEFYRLSVSEVRKYLRNVVQQQDGTPVDDYWLEEDMRAFLIAKFNPIGIQQPHLIKVVGTDYEGWYLLNLDNKKQLISSVVLHAGETSGPEVSEDTLVITRPELKCNFKGKLIEKGLLIRRFDPSKDTYQQIFGDSIASHIRIKESGEITYGRIDTLHFEETRDINSFRQY